MIVYNYFNYIGYLAILVYFTLSIIILSIIIWLAKQLYSFRKSNDYRKKASVVVILVVSIVPLILAVGFIKNFIGLSYEALDFKNDNVLITEGVIDNISFSLSDGRGVQYDIIIIIDDTVINMDMPIDKSTLDQICSLQGKRVKITSNKNDINSIYEIMSLY